MSLWYVNMLGTWIEVLNHFENLLFKKKILRFCEMILIQYRWKGTCE